MADGVRLLAVVPARGGSQRLPRKNVLPLAGKPLIGWTLEPALACGLFEAVLVSTDDEEIAAVSKEFGASVPWLRPAALATDTASSADVLRHALGEYERERGAVDAVVLLQPTSPFRTLASIRAAVAQYRAQPVPSPLVSVGPAAIHPAWCFRLEGTAMTPFVGWELLGQRSQDLPAAFALNGAIYIIPAGAVRSGLPILAPGVQAFLMEDAEESHDIDTEADWRRAEQIALRRAQPGHVG